MTTYKVHQYRYTKKYPKIYFVIRFFNKSVYADNGPCNVVMHFMMSGNPLMFINT